MTEMNADDGMRDEGTSEWRKLHQPACPAMTIPATIPTTIPTAIPTAIQ
jgi:hypothetical protein